MQVSQPTDDGVSDIATHEEQEAIELKNAHFELCSIVDSPELAEALLGLVPVIKATLATAEADLAEVRAELAEAYEQQEPDDDEEAES